VIEPGGAWLFHTRGTFNKAFRRGKMPDKVVRVGKSTNGPPDYRAGSRVLR